MLSHPLRAVNKKVPEITYITSQVTATDASSYSWTQDVGVGLLVIMFHSESVAANIPTHSATVNGVSMSVATQFNYSVTGRSNICIAYLNNTTPGTKTIVTNLGTVVARCWVSFYLITNFTSTTPVYTFSTGANNANPSASYTGLSPSGSVGLIGATTHNLRTITWSNATGNYTGTGTETTWSAMAASFSSIGTTTRTVTGTLSTADPYAVAAAAWS